MALTWLYCFWEQISFIRSALLHHLLAVELGWMYLTWCCLHSIGNIPLQNRAVVLLLKSQRREKPLLREELLLKVVQLWQGKIGPFLLKHVTGWEPQSTNMQTKRTLRRSHVGYQLDNKNTSKCIKISLLRELGAEAFWTESNWILKTY